MMMKKKSTHAKSCEAEKLLRSLKASVNFEFVSRYKTNHCCSDAALLDYGCPTKLLCIYDRSIKPEHPNLLIVL